MHNTESIQHPSRFHQFLGTRRDLSLVMMAAFSVAATAGTTRLLGISMSWWGFLLGLAFAGSLRTGFHAMRWAAIGAALAASASAAAFGADVTWPSALVVLTLWGFQRR